MNNPGNYNSNIFNLNGFDKHLKSFFKMFDKKKNKNKKSNLNTSQISEQEQKAVFLNQQAKIDFKNKKYREAIIKYGAAINLHKDPKYPTNIAKCFAKMNQPKDSVKAIEISISWDSNNSVLYQLAGKFAFQAFQKQENIQFAYKCESFFRNAHEIEPTKTNKYNYLLSRKMIFLVKEFEMFKEKQELMYYFDQMDDKTSLASNPKSFQKSFHNFDKKDIFKETYFDEKKEIPSFVSGCISLEILKEPLMTPSGYSYEKSGIIEWCQKSGCKDPMSGKDFPSIQCLIENKVLKLTISDLIKKHKWIFDDEMSGDDWKCFEFR